MEVFEDELSSCISSSENKVNISTKVGTGAGAFILANGLYGVATATVCARFGLKCIVFMGKTDVERQAPNVFRMKLLGADVISVTSGRGTLKDAMNEALRDWVTCFY